LPKNLLKINNHPIIDYQLSNLPAEYINSLVIILGHQGKKLKKHIDSLNLQYPVKYYDNYSFKDTNCAYSLLFSRNEMQCGFVLINCDLLFLKKNIIRLLKSKFSNTITVRNNNITKTDLQDILIADGKVSKWKLNIQNANAEIMGPLIMNDQDAKIVINYYNSLTIKEQKKLHCFSLFSNCLDNVSYYPIYINDDEWEEVDSLLDLENAENKITSNAKFLL